MSSRFRSLGPRDRRLNSQWPDVPEVSWGPEGSKNRLARASEEGEGKKRGVRWCQVKAPWYSRSFSCIKKSVQSRKHIIKALVAKNKAPSPRSAVPGGLCEQGMWGQAKALRSSSKAIGLFIFQSLYESLLSTVWSPRGHSTQLLTVLQRHPAEHLDHLVLMNTTGHETSPWGCSPPVQEWGSEMARISYVARKSHVVATTVSHCCHHLASTYLSSDRGESASLLALSC